jgi:hypothetical protein
MMSRIVIVILIYHRHRAITLRILNCFPEMSRSYDWQQGTYASNNSARLRILSLSSVLFLWWNGKWIQIIWDLSGPVQTNLWFAEGEGDASELWRSVNCLSRSAPCVSYPETKEKHKSPDQIWDLVQGVLNAVWCCQSLPPSSCSWMQKRPNSVSRHFCFDPVSAEWSFVRQCWINAAVVIIEHFTELKRNPREMM